LKFDLGYVSNTPNRPLRPLVCSVEVNGTTVWREETGVTKDWQPREISLAEYGGRKILIALSARNQDATGDHPAEAPVWFGRARVDNNPASLAPITGEGLPGPGTILISGPSDEKELARDWRQQVSPANGRNATITVDRGLLSFSGQHYKYEQLLRPLGEGYADLTIQARIRVSPTGCSIGWHPALNLYWARGKYCRYTGGNDQLVIGGIGARTIRLAPRRMAVTDDNLYDFWLKMSLTRDKIRCFSSLDGKTWNQEAEVTRPADCAGPPAFLILGRGQDGEKEYLQNDAKWETGPSKAYIGELLIGRD